MRVSKNLEDAKIIERLSIFEKTALIILKMTSPQPYNNT